jgi:hypothetical protein
VHPLERREVPLGPARLLGGKGPGPRPARERQAAARALPVQQLRVARAGRRAAIRATGWWCAGSTP